MKTIEESFKAEKEILEEFFKNRKLKIKNKKIISFYVIRFSGTE